MLQTLAIRNIALIESLELSFASGFSALTGETGAGKSLLMDALGLALGERADTSLIRHGQQTADISATFTPPESPALHAVLEGQGLALEEGQLTLRRQLKKDGASRAWVNATPVTVAVLAELAAHLVDIHAQHGTHALLKPAAQRDLLDSLAGHAALRQTTAQTFAAWQAAQQALAAAQAELEQAAANATLFTAWREELEELNYRPGEEETLATQRTRLANLTQLSQHLATADAALSSEGGALTALRTAARALAAACKVDDSLTALHTRLATLQTELEDAAHDIARQSNSLEGEGSLEEIDDRLHTLKAAARKHRVDIPALTETRERLTRQTTSLATLEDKVEELAAAANAAQKSFHAAAQALTAARAQASQSLAPRFQDALQKLELPHATLAIRLEPLPQQSWNAAGAEAVEILLSANPGNPPQPIARVASGGELSRLMLALKTVLYQTLQPQTVVFDEIDTGLSGPTASAVGRAMAEIARHHQVLSITHHPQVAACAQGHLRLSKQVEGGATVARVQALQGPTRVEELARLLSGATVTPQARAAAQALLEESKPAQPSGAKAA